jgi:hypothetical protein
MKLTKTIVTLLMFFSVGLMFIKLFMSNFPSLVILISTLVVLTGLINLRFIKKDKQNISFVSILMWSFMSIMWLFYCIVGI